MDDLERRLLNRFQGGFPLRERPFSRVAAELDSDEDTLLECIRAMLDDGLLSRFGPLYDASSMGGALTLAALEVPEDRYEEVAETVNALDEVAHNYRREHRLNMWFVLATATPGQLRDCLRHIQATVGLPVYDFPKRQTFYLGLWLHVDDDGKVTTVPVPGPLKQGGMIVDELDRAIVQATQAGLPLQRAPYAGVAERCGCESSQVIERLQRMLDCGVIRRIGAVPNHYRLGLRANGMSVWDVSDDRLLELGSRVGRLDFVSHCYERPRRAPVWPYNLFAMVHGHDRDEVRAKVDEIASLLGRHARGHEVLFSTRILKKTGLRLVA